MPIFEYRPGARGRTAAPDLPVPPSYDRVNEDPFMPLNELRKQSVEARVSWLGDAGMWCQQFVSECATTARKLETLRRKLADPALADSPHRTKAVYRADEMRDDMIQHARDAVWTEAEGDRYWQSLTVEQRAPIAGHWMTSPETPRLIGAAFLRISTFETWPLRFRLHRMMFNDFPWPLITDMNDSDIWLWDPHPGPPDPFPDQGRMPAKIAKQLNERGAI